MKQAGLPDVAHLCHSGTFQTLVEQTMAHWKIVAHYWKRATIFDVKTENFICSNIWYINL